MWGGSGGGHRRAPKRSFRRVGPPLHSYRWGIRDVPPRDGRLWYPRTPPSPGGADKLPLPPVRLGPCVVSPGDRQQALVASVATRETPQTSLHRSQAPSSLLLSRSAQTYSSTAEVFFTNCREALSPRQPRVETPRPRKKQGHSGLRGREVPAILAGPIRRNLTRRSVLRPLRQELLTSVRIRLDFDAYARILWSVGHRRTIYWWYARNQRPPVRGTRGGRSSLLGSFFSGRIPQSADTACVLMYTNSHGCPRVLLRKERQSWTA
jgi:hypothetical protein